MLKTCPFCKKEVISNVYVCPHCTRVLRERIAINRLNKHTQENYHNISSNKKNKFKGEFILCFLIIIVIIVLPIFWSNLTNNSIANIRNAYAEEIKKTQNDFDDEYVKLRNNYNNEIAKLDIDELGKKAEVHYDKIWQERISLDSKYAITPREKAQLEMLALSKDRTKKIEDIIKVVALKAAPRNSTVNVYTSTNGHNLDIDFDMSELSNGEDGTKTKHETINSLKQDVIRLISKVTNDVYQFSQSLDLESIAIGCRHFVDQYDADYGTSLGEQNIILYKIRLNKKDLGELKNNPFLDIYSTTKYFKVEEDDFPNLKIEISQL